MRMKTFSIGSHCIGQDAFTIIAGPCSIESFEQFQTIVNFLKQEGVHFIRGGIFKPRTNPKDFQGLREKAFPIVKELKKQTDFLFVTEISDCRQLDSLMDITDVFQIGARNMYNYELLKELGKINRPVLLKRSFSASIKEWLMAGEYVRQGGNDRIILCERGIRTFETAYRNTYDINAVIHLQKMSPYPVFVDPSHATGLSFMVSPAAQSALTAGAQGLLVEVHNEPEKALSDGAQALSLNQMSQLMKDLKKLSQALSKSFS